MLDLERLDAAEIARAPFAYAIVPGFVRKEFRDTIETDYPRIKRSGSFPLPALSCGPAFAELIRELTAPRMCALIGQKLGIDLDGRPTMVTVRGQCTARDGYIHTDSTTKLVTMLLYTNRPWECAAARLRLLRSATDLDDYVAEVPAEESTLVLFRNASNAWHGFAPFHGERRVIQVNWVTDERVVAREQTRHRVSAYFKRLFGSSDKSHAAAH
ncbi:MAG TPA: 2OG-Fe(II) oxygenase [Rhizomicrobium sp.]|jgi:hypothetical protein